MFGWKKLIEKIQFDWSLNRIKQEIHSIKNEEKCIP